MRDGQESEGDEMMDGWVRKMPFLEEGHQSRNASGHQKLERQGTISPLVPTLE